MSFRAGPISLPDETQTQALAERLAALLHPGDTLLLSGPIGTGKSFFARAVIRSRLGNPQEEVPSPTFTLVQSYEDDTSEIWHCDLYRLTNPFEIVELGLDDAMGRAICMIEWPDRLGDAAPADALTLEFEAGDPAHRLTLSGSDRWGARLETVLG